MAQKRGSYDAKKTAPVAAAAPTLAVPPDPAPEAAPALAVPAEPEMAAADAPRPRTEAPMCPNCKDTVCQAQRSLSLFTWFVCPGKCGFRIKVARPDIRKQLERQRAQGPAVKRP